MEFFADIIPCGDLTRIKHEELDSECDQWWQVGEMGGVAALLEDQRTTVE